MSLVNISVEKKSEGSVNRATEIFKKLSLDTMQSAQRPLSYDPFRQNHRNRHQYTLNRFCYDHVNLWDLYRLQKYSDILQIITTARGRELVRNGFNFEPLTKLANEDQKEKAEAWIRKINNNNQDLKELSKQLSSDLDWADDAYLLASKDYKINANNEIVGGEVKEFIRIDPLTIQMVVDKDSRLGYDYETGHKIYFNLQTRQQSFDEFDQESGLPNLEAHYKVITDEGDKFYNSGEILHVSLFNPSITYGFSPLYSLYPKVLILITQDDYIRKFYGDDKPPKGFMVFNTNNKAGLAKAIDEYKQRTAMNPHAVMPIINENKEGKQMVEYIDMSRNLQEMQYTETRNEIRNQIGAVYGVSPVFQNDVSTSGGLNNEGLQITITNRAIEDLQTLFNEKILDFIFRVNLGISQWTITYNPSEEEDEVWEADLEAKELANVRAKLEMGMKGYVDENGKYTFEAGELELDQGGGGFLPFEASADKITKTQANITTSASGHTHNWTKDMQYTDIVNGHHHEIDEFNMIAKPAEEGGHSHKLLDEPSYEPENDGKEAVIKAKLPPGAEPLGDKNPPKGARVITGPRGGKYIVPDKTEGQEGKPSGSDKPVDTEEDKPKDKETLPVWDKPFKEPTDPVSKWLTGSTRDWVGAGDVKPLSKETISKFNETKERFNVKHDVFLAPFSSNKNVLAFTQGEDENRNIYVVQGGDENYKKINDLYKEDILQEELEPEIRQIVNETTPDDFKEMTILHEDGHLRVFEKFGGPVGIDEMKKKDKRMEEYEKLVDVGFGINENGRMHETLAEDIRIVNARLQGGRSGLIFNKEQTMRDIQDIPRFQRRLEIIEDMFFEGGKV
jgi:hypothetical protein